MKTVDIKTNEAAAIDSGATFSPAKPMEAETISNGRSSKSLMSRGTPKVMGNSNRRDFIQKLFVAGMVYAAALPAGCDKPGGDPEVPGGYKDPRVDKDLEAEIKKLIDRIAPGHTTYADAHYAISVEIEKLINKTYEVKKESFVSGTFTRGGILDRINGVDNLSIKVSGANNCRKTKIDKDVTSLGAERGKFHHNIVCDDK